MSVLDRIRAAIRDGHYKFTDHAIQAARADGLHLHDMVDVLMTGQLDSTYTEDLRGTRYVVRGLVLRDEVDVVCRFERDGSNLIIITVYVVD